MRRVMILVFDPRPESAIEGLEIARIRVDQRGEELRPYGPKPSLELALRLGLKRSRMNKGHTEFGAYEGEMARAIRRAVVDVQPLAQAAATDRPFQDREERGHRLVPREGGGRNDPRGVIEQRDEIGFMASAIVDVEDARAVHDVTHPEFVGRVEREAAAVLCRRLVWAARHQALATEQPMDGRGREPDLGRDELLLARRGDQHRHTEGGVRLFERTQLVGHGLRERAHVPGVAPRARLERVEAAAPIGVEPIAHGFGGDTAARAARDLILAIGFLAQLRVQQPVARWQM